MPCSDTSTEPLCPGCGGGGGGGGGEEGSSPPQRSGSSAGLQNANIAMKPHYSRNFLALGWMIGDSINACSFKTHNYESQAEPVPVSTLQHCTFTTATSAVKSRESSQQTLRSE